MNYLTWSALTGFALYMGASMALLAAFTRLYIWVTPYDEIVQIGCGKKAPAFALGGAMLGFTFPLLSLSCHGSNIIDFLVWSVVAGITQLLLFKFLYHIIPMQVEEDNQAVGVFYSFAAVCIGLINAFSLIPS